MHLPQGAHLLSFWFTTPALAWAGAALVSIPIIIHLLNRRRFHTVTWAAMEFLLRAMKKNRRRLRFEQWLLLATRCLLLLLLGVALARPVGCENETLAGFGRHSSLDVYIIDNSYSAGYEVNRPDARTHLDQAKKVIAALMNRPETGGQSVALITAGRPATAVIAIPQHDMASARSALGRVDQTYASTDVAGALQLALKVARENSAQPNKNLYILTDGTRSAWQGAQAKALQQIGPDLSATFNKITHFNLSGGASQWNAAVTDLRPVDNLVTTAFKSEFRANVKVFGPGREGTLQWHLDDSTLPPGGPAGMAEIGFQTGGAHVLSVQIPSDDRLPVDNVRQRVVDVASKLKILIVQDRAGSGPLGGSGAFLGTALAPLKPAEPGKPQVSDSPFDPEVITDLELDRHVLGDYAAVILAGVGELSPAKAEALRLYTQGGGALFIFMGDAVGKDNYNTSGLLPGRLIERKETTAQESGYHFDFDPNRPLHPYLSLFANQPNTGLDVARIFKYWQLELDPAAHAERVLNYLPDQDPRSRAAGTLTDLEAEQARIAGELGAYHEHSAAAPPIPGVLDKLAADQEALAKRLAAAADQVRSARSLPLDERKRTALESAIKQLTDLGAQPQALAGAIKSDSGSAADSAGQMIETLKKIVLSLEDAGAKVGLGDPAIVTSVLGKGRVLLFSTSADNAWTSIDAKPNYVPLIHELLRGIVRSRDWWMNLTVGEPLEIPPTLRLRKAPTLIDAAGAPVVIEPVEQGGDAAYRTAPLTRPGVYRLSLGDETVPIAVNVPAAEEADIVPIKDEQIAKALGDIKMTLLSYELPPEATSTHEDNDFSWWTMAAVLTLVGFECFIAMKFGHHRRLAEAPTTPVLAPS